MCVVVDQCLTEEHKRASLKEVMKCFTSLFTSCSNDSTVWTLINSHGSHSTVVAVVGVQIPDDKFC